MQARAKFDFVASERDELSFTRGSILKIISMEDDANWYKAELRADTGYVPKTYIEMLPHPWFYGKISRIDSERLLLSKRADGKMLQSDGAFLVRYSESSPGDFSISVKCQNSVQHYKILRGEGKYYLWVVKFDSINELIDYHRKSSVSRSSNLPLVDLLDNRRTLSRPNGFPAVQQHQSYHNNAGNVQVGSNPTSNFGTQPLHQMAAGNGGLQAFNGASGGGPMPRIDNGFPAPVSAPIPGSSGSQYVRAQFDFNSREAGEISMKQGDVIRVIDTYDQNWLKGENNGRVGLLPVTYVRPMS